MHALHNFNGNHLFKKILCSQRDSGVNVRVQNTILMGKKKIQREMPNSLRIVYLILCMPKIYFNPLSRFKCYFFTKSYKVVNLKHNHMKKKKTE